MARVEHNADQVAEQLRILGQRIVRELANKEARFADATISALATGTFMRDAGGEGRRRRGDTGPLRIVTGRLARGTASKLGRGGGSGEGKTTVTTTRRTIQVKKEVSVPYASVHENGFQDRVSVSTHTRTSRTGTTYNVKPHERNMNIPKRAFLQPALVQARPKIRSHFERNARRTAERILDAR